MADLITVKTDIVLIGPIRAGKSTVGRLLAQRLGIPQVSCDSLCRNYYQEIGFDVEEQYGPDGMIAARFNVYAVQRLLQDHQSCLFDLGAGHSVYREADSLDQVRQALAAYPNVFLLLPCANLDAAENVLEARNTENEWLHNFRAQRRYDPNAHFLRHESNFLLAKQIIYTEGCSPEETADEIIAKMV